VANLNYMLGELNIDAVGTGEQCHQDYRLTFLTFQKAPYMLRHRVTVTEILTLEEKQFEIETIILTCAQSAVTIPTELMLPEQRLSRYLDYFFTHIHPYIPVLSPSLFSHEWYYKRNTISPFLLEAIFACSARLMDIDPSHGSRWLALATSKLIDSYVAFPESPAYVS